MSVPTPPFIRDVAAAIARIYDVPVTVEYPGFIEIPESAVTDDADGSDAVWQWGQDYDGERVVWTGQLTKDGALLENGLMVAPADPTDVDVVAAAIYTHGIGDLYIGGGCTDADCPCVHRLSSSASSQSYIDTGRRGITPLKEDR